MKKYLILTALVCLCCFLKANAQTGPCGDNAFRTLADSVLTISGSGAMYDFTGSGNQAGGKDLPFNAASINVTTPWYSQRLAINKIVIESGITAIGVHSFAGLQNVRQLVWHEGITHIGTAAFFFCENPEALNIPDSLTYIHEEVFYALRSLKRIIIPPKVTGINLQAFQECTSATVLDVSASVIFINRNAFNCCDGLTKVINRSLDPSYHVSGAAFTGVDLSKITLAVYPEVIDDYRNAPVWGSFGTIIAISNDAALQSLRVNTGTLSPAFNPDTLSYHVTVPNDVTGITVTPSARHSEAI